MTVSTTTVVSGPYTPDGVVTTFPYAFVAFTADEIAVYGEVDGVQTPITAGWTATGLGTGAGNIVFRVAPSAAIGALYFASDPVFNQSLVLDNGGAFYGPSIEQAFDRSVVRDLVISKQATAASAAVQALSDTLALGGYTDVFAGDGTSTAFELAHTPLSIGALSVSVGGSSQTPGSSFTLSGAVITFTEAPPSGASVVAAYRASS